MLDYSYTISSIFFSLLFLHHVNELLVSLSSAGPARDGIPFSAFASDNVVNQLTVDKMQLTIIATHSIMLSFLPFQYFLTRLVCLIFFFCGEYRSRTDDLLLAKQAL